MRDVETRYDLCIMRDTCVDPCDTSIWQNTQKTKQEKSDRDQIGLSTLYTTIGYNRKPCHYATEPVVCSWAEEMLVV